MTEGQIAYRAYLKSEHWKWLRSEAFRVLGRKCRKCPAIKKLHVHHLRYRFPWESCTVDDLTILCRNCHRAEHGLKPVKTRKKGVNRTKKPSNPWLKSKYFYTKPYIHVRRWTNRDSSSN